MARLKAQSALEYIFASIAFTLVGVGMVTALSTAAWNKAGVLSDYDVVSGSVNPDTLAGATLKDGVAENKTWPGVDQSYAGSWKNTQTMSMSGLDPEELDPTEAGFYATRNSAVPNQGLDYQQQVDEEAKEGGGESFWVSDINSNGDEGQWTDVGTRKEWKNIGQTWVDVDADGSQTTEAEVEVASDATESAVAATERSESDVQESFNQAVAGRKTAGWGTAGFVLEDDYWRYNGAWADEDGHRSGYREGEFPTR